MSVIRVKHLPEFKDEADVVLVVVDDGGLAIFVAALVEALQRGESRLQRCVRSHEFVIVNGAADIAVGVECVSWRLDRAKASEIMEKTRALGKAGKPGHHYIDGMNSPAGTLVLSLNEYLTQTWLTDGEDPILADEDPT